MLVNYLDIILLLPLAWGAFIGFKKGLVIEIATLVGIGLGIYGAIEGSDFFANWLSEQLDWSERLIRITSFVVTFLAIVICVHLLGKGIEKIIKLAALGLVNRITGSVFGVMKYALILTLVLYFVDRINARYPFLEEETVEESLLYEPLSKVIPAVYPGISAFTQEDQD